MRTRGCGGIGRRARFRFWWETVGVRVPSPAGNKSSQTLQGSAGFCYTVEYSLKEKERT